MIEVASRVPGVLRLLIPVKQNKKCVHLGSSLLIFPFGGSFPLSCCSVWRGSRLECGQAYACLARALVPEQRDHELVSEGGIDGAGVVVGADAVGADAGENAGADSGEGTVAGGGEKLGGKDAEAGADTGAAKVME